MPHFADVIAHAMDSLDSFACVGLDPVVEKLPVPVRSSSGTDLDAVGMFCLGVLDAVAGVVPAVKIQAACFERYGGEGVSAMHAVIRAAKERGLVVVLDAKRGDIGISAEHYAAAAFGTDDPANTADALTVNAYLGMDTIDPYLAHDSRGLFVLVRTSNPASDGVQSAALHDGRTVAELMADLVAHTGRERRGACGLSDLGAVVGATKAGEGASLRARMPDSIFLVPGYGAQGGTAADVRAMLRPGRGSAGTAGVLVTASRSVIYAFAHEKPDWTLAVHRAAEQFVAELRAIQ